MTTIIEQAGWGIYPVLLFGIGMLAIAVVYAIVPRPQFLPLLATFVVSTWMSGAMGTLRGIQTTAQWAHEAGGSLATFFEPFSQSLLCLQTAIGLTFIAMLLTMIGAARFAAARPKSPLPHPGSSRAS